MDVRFYATLRQVVGGKTVALDIAAEATVHDVLVAAGNRFPGLVPLIWAEPGVLGDYVKVFVDGREIRHLQLLATPVSFTAEIDIFPPVAGG